MASIRVAREMGLASLIDRPGGGALDALLPVLLNPREIVPSQKGDQQVAPLAVRQAGGEFLDVGVEQRRLRVRSGWRTWFM